MKTIKTLLTVLIASLLLVSCKKDSSVSSSSLVKTYTENITSSSIGNSITTYDLNYDADNRITSLVAASDPGDKFVYNYNSNNSYTMDIYESGIVSLHEIFYINNLSLVDSTLQYSDGDTSTEKYYYNGAKQLTKLDEYEYSVFTGAELDDSTIYAYDNSGNLITETNLEGVTTYDYSGATINNLDVGQIYFSFGKYLPTTVIATQYGVSITANHTYTFDGQNRLTSDKIVSSDGVVIKTYTY